LLPGGESAVFVPRNAIVRDKTTDSYQVFTIANNTAHLRVVVVGDVEGDTIRIVNGLTGNETVAASGQSELFDGAQVQPQARQPMHTLAQLCVRRPVFAPMLILSLVVVGIFS